MYARLHLWVRIGHQDSQHQACVVQVSALEYALHGVRMERIACAALKVGVRNV